MTKNRELLVYVYELEKRMQETVTAADVCSQLQLDRSTASRYLNQLVREALLIKREGRPVQFLLSDKGRQIALEEPLINQAPEFQTTYNERFVEETEGQSLKVLDLIIGAYDTLHVAVQQAKAAILYPPRGLHTLLLGETGVGKSMFAELMHRYAIESKMIKASAPFEKFNCADYAENPQLLVAQIFGVKKGAFTGADKDREGLLERANGGILFLDEVHRLSPQGQEMLFTFIDKGQFRKLGDAETLISSSVQIIAATTEDTGSFLLKTFTRRIPMTITLPSLKERTLKERFELTRTFIKEESKRVNRSIYMHRSALIAMLLYDCPNNIGQLKSDIQLSCAKAFLNYKSKDKNYIMINSSDLPAYVKKGIIDAKDKREAIDHLLKSKDDIFKFCFEEEEILLYDDSEAGSELFYEVIERKLEDLKKSGVEEDEIKNILNIDIETHFQKYLGNLPKRFNRDEIEKLVDATVLDAVDYILLYAKEKLSKVYDEKIYFGMALHLHSSIERLRSGGKIYHPKLNFIRVTYNDEFFVAMEVAKYLDKTFDIETSLDEIGYITMFLASNPYDLSELEDQRVGIIVMMHGNSTASSMAAVANHLVGEDHVTALDMPLSMKAGDMYEIAKAEVMRIDKGKGVLLLVDMGSLTHFSDMIFEETGIIVKTIDMVSTPLAIEACRKAVMGRDLFEIYNSCVNEKRQHSMLPTRNTDRSRVILTACFTGEGASERLKSMIQTDLLQDESIEVRPVNFLNKYEFSSTVKLLSENYIILAVVGTVSVEIEEVPFISAVDYLNGSGKRQLQMIIKQDNLVNNLSQSLKEHITTCETDLLVQTNKMVMQQLLQITDSKLPDDVYTGMMLHLCFMVDRKLKYEPPVAFEGFEAYQMEHSEQLASIKAAFLLIERTFGIEVDPHELAHVLRMILSNKL